MPLPHINQAAVRSELPKHSVLVPKGKQSIRKLLLAGTWYKNRLEELASDSARVDKREVRSWEVFELSALLVQFADINELQNGREFRWPERFFDHISKSDGTRYGDVLRLARDLFQQRGETFDPILMSLLVHWSILGDYSQDQNKASPAFRFARAWEHVAEIGFPVMATAIGNPTAVFGSWSAALKLSEPAMGLNHTRDLLQQLMENVELATLSDALWKDQFKTLLPTLKGIAKSSDHMRLVVQQRPMDYIDPVRYVNSHSLFSNMNFRTIVDGFVEFKDVIREPQSFDLDYISDVDGGPKTVISEAGSASTHSFVDLQAALKTATVVGVTDLFFRDNSVRHFEAKRARRLFEEEFEIAMREVLY